jgi:hypothetical protein
MTTATDLFRFQTGGKVVEGDGPFIFIAMIGASQQCGGAVAVADHTDGQH